MGPEVAAATRTLVVWCPDWPVVAAGAPPDEPAAVVSANRVIACSPAAREEGVRRGLRRREAQARCPALTVLDHDPARDARAFEPVVAAVAVFAPRVEVIRPGVCALATRGPSRYFGGDDALAVKVAGTVGWSSRVGIADGVFAATLAARRGVVVPPGASAAFLAPFPIGTLDRPELVDLLVRLGIRTIGAFAVLPAADVLGRFGDDGVVAHRLACGLEERPLDARRPPADLAVQIELDPPVNRVDAAAFAAKMLADQLHGALAAQGLACTRVCIEAETEHGEQLARLWRHDGALSAAAMAERMRWQLDGWLTAAATGGAGGPTGGLSLLRLTPDEVRPDSGRQLGFWGGTAEATDRAARAFARVQGMLGPEAVQVPVPSGGRSPAEQVSLVPWGDAREAVRPADRPWPGRLPPPSPTVVHPEPLPADVVDAAGAPVVVTARCLLRTPPARVCVGAAGRWSAVRAWAGPWPVDERWWDGDARRRRARFQVVLADGTAHLLSVEASRWSVEATYD